MIGDKWTIYWDNYMANAYTFGTRAVFHAVDDVEFANDLVPSGVELKKWFSKTAYQSQGIEPSLPIIDGEATYKITVDMDLQKEEGIFVNLVFYNKYDVEVGKEIIRNKEKVFRCPLATYSYVIVLVSSGADSFRFHSFTIQEVADEPEEQIKKDKKRIWKSKKASRKNEKAKR